ncbi:hypothetical protein FNH04_04625 [Streptomyces phyllanthi]|uniref:Alpha/beta hydrolase n=1 Tax=Streptomyces phyllanthi TaxID=1803180 RepID=A0A5N8VZ70_9ACTN|nr:hypothetical protein [Streptomyces phyllanthi]
MVRADQFRAGRRRRAGGDGGVHGLHVGFRAPRRYPETLNDITCWSEFDLGGHFPAMEEPDLLSADIRGFFRRLA